jgi:hypothetical protein
MQQLVELYEMVALNENALCENERQAILQARLALGMFERAMQSFKTQLSETSARTESAAGAAIAPVGSFGRTVWAQRVGGQR